MRRGRRGWMVSGLVVVPLLAAVWGAYGLVGGGGGDEGTSSVRTVAATKANVVDMVTAAGVLQSRYSANVDFSTAGTVKEIDVKVGDAVSKGQRLATLDDALANKQVQVARANLDAARQQLTDAVTKGAPTAQPRAQVQQAELQLEQAQDALAATVLTAPGDGTVVSLSGTIGQRTGGGTSGGGGQNSASGNGAFLAITDMANLTARASVVETDVSKLKPDQQASVTVNALPNQPIQAKVTEIGLAPTNSDGLARYGVSLALTDPPPTLRPGQSASVQVTVAEVENTLAVPPAALRTAGGQSTVTVLTKGQQVRRAVGTGVRGEALVQITSGLQEGDQVVLPSASGGQGEGDRGSGSGSRFGGGG
jgi:membrane fusion protein, macrolide-specific efflux system